MMKRRNYICCSLLLALTACTNGYNKYETIPSSAVTGENAVIQTPSLNKVTPTATPSYAMVDFNVNDIRIGAMEAEVLQKLGKPIKRSKVKIENCGEETVLRLNYPGLEIDLSSDETGINYVALSFLVTSSNGI